MKNYSELVKHIQQLYYHASDNMPKGYDLHALRLDKHSRRELELGAQHLLRFDYDADFPHGRFMGLKVIVEHEVFIPESMESAEIKNEPIPIFESLAIECKQPGEHGRSVYFDYEKTFGPWNKTEPEHAK